MEAPEQSLHTQIPDFVGARQPVSAVDDPALLRCVVIQSLAICEIYVHERHGAIHKEADAAVEQRKLLQGWSCLGQYADRHISLTYQA